MLNSKSTYFQNSKYSYLLILFATLVTASVIINSFTKSGNCSIKPLDKEFNSQLKFGVQYYVISRSGNYGPEELAILIQRYRNANVSMFSGAELVLFYKHSYFNNYQGRMYESARDNEFGGIEGFQQSLIAKIWLKKSGADDEEHLIIYQDGKMVYNKIRHNK